MKLMKRTTVLASVVFIFFLVGFVLQSKKSINLFGRKKVLYLKPVDYRTLTNDVDDFTFDGETNYVLENKENVAAVSDKKGSKSKKTIEIQEEDESDESSLEDDEEVTYYSHNNSDVVPRLVRGRQYASNDFVTLITQFTPERAKVFKMICEAWDGSISAVVGVKDKSDQPGVPEWRVDTFLKKFPNRKNIKIYSYNITNLDMTKYPINYLRNIAWDAATTPYMFLLDVDFVPSLNTHKYLIKSMILNFYLNAKDSSSLPTDKLAYVVPAFEAKTAISSINDKDHALTLLRKEMIFIWGAKHHQASNYPRWKTAKTDYCQEPDTIDEYEPYIVVPWYAPQYDPRFLGYSKNKKSQILELILAGYSFVISHNTLITHMPHRRSKHYQLAGRDDNAQNWEDFIRERNEMYPDMIARCDKIDWMNLISSKHIPYPVAPIKPKVEEKIKEEGKEDIEKKIKEKLKETEEKKILSSEEKQQKEDISKNVEDEIEKIKMKAEQLEKLAEEEEEEYDEYEEDPIADEDIDVEEEEEEVDVEDVEDEVDVEEEEEELINN